MPVKKICEKKVRDITYILRLFEGDNKYVIFKRDGKKMMDGRVHRIPEIAVFNNEKDAQDFFR